MRHRKSDKLVFRCRCEPYANFFFSPRVINMHVYDAELLFFPFHRFLFSFIHRCSLSHLSISVSSRTFSNANSPICVLSCVRGFAGSLSSGFLIGKFCDTKCKIKNDSCTIKWNSNVASVNSQILPRIHKRWYSMDAAAIFPHILHYIGTPKLYATV